MRSASPSKLHLNSLSGFLFFANMNIKKSMKSQNLRKAQSRFLSSPIFFFLSLFPCFFLSWKLYIIVILSPLILLQHPLTFSWLGTLPPLIISLCENVFAGSHNCFVVTTAAAKSYPRRHHLIVLPPSVAPTLSPLPLTWCPRTSEWMKSMSYLGWAHSSQLFSALWWVRHLCSDCNPC